jgi:hypothetical protein
VARETALVHTLGRFMPPELFRSTPFSDSSRRLNCEEIAESTVYNNAGALLGSWAAAGLNAQAQLEGIATNGTDVWLLDNKTDKVYKYAGAASRLSGSQSAASSFSLASGNTNGKGIVTDGASLWVVDDGAGSDKVYKYTVSGALKGSWTIDAANSSPTGLTIDPNNVSDIWIVDSGTKKVYQYTAAAGRTSGGQSAAATFALAANNTNPQDIADPPPAGMMLTPAAASVAAFPSLPGHDAIWTMLDGATFGQPFGISPDHTAARNVAVQSGDPSSSGDRQFTHGSALYDLFASPSAVPNFASQGLTATGLVRDLRNSSLSNGNPGGQQTPLTPAVINGADSEPGAADLYDDALSTEDRPASTAATDAVFVLLADPASED